MAEYSLSEVSRIFQLSPARLRYWQRTALIPATAVDGQPVFGFRDLVCIRTVKALLESGVPIRRIRRSVANLRERIPELERPLDSLRVWLEGSDRVVVRHAGALMQPDGQLVLDLALAPPEADDVRALRPEVAAPGDPASALDWFELGCQLDAEPGRQEEALQAYRRAVEGDPDFADAHCNLGLLLEALGRRQEAIRHLMTARQLNESEE